MLSVATAAASEFFSEYSIWIPVEIECEGRSSSARIPDSSTRGMANAVLYYPLLSDSYYMYDVATFRRVPRLVQQGGRSFFGVSGVTPLHGVMEAFSIAT